MLLLLGSVLMVLIVSALCSLSEASLYAVRTSYVRRQREVGGRAGRLLADLKENMEQPISAILILNTVANTAGAALAGGQARVVLGEAWLIWFSAGFTVAVLVVSEILPKVVGVVYCGPISRAAAQPLALLIVVLRPAIWLIQRLTRRFLPSDPLPEAPEEEVAEVAKLSADEGSILQFEADLIQHVLRLNDVLARDIMTPRSDVFELSANATLREVQQQVTAGTRSRIPLISADPEPVWTGVVLRRDVLAEFARDRYEMSLQSLCSPIVFVRDDTPGHVLLKSFMARQSHLFGVKDESGQAVGIVSLEDVLEALLGRDIEDEVDLRRRWRATKPEENKG